MMIRPQVKGDKLFPLRRFFHRSPLERSRPDTLTPKLVPCGMLGPSLKTSLTNFWTSYYLNLWGRRDETAEELWAEMTRLWPADFNIPNLQNHENHYQWFRYTRGKLEVLNLWGFIEGTERLPQFDGPIDEQIHHHFSQRLYRAYMIIHDSVKPILPELRMKGFSSKKMARTPKPYGKPLHAGTSKSPTLKKAGC